MNIKKGEPVYGRKRASNSGAVQLRERKDYYYNDSRN